MDDIDLQEMEMDWEQAYYDAQAAMDIQTLQAREVLAQRDALVEALEWAIGYAPRNEPEYEQAEKALQTYYYAQLDEL